MNVGWGAVGLGVLLLAGALLRFIARKAPPPRRVSPALADAVKLADLCREARALSSRKAWKLLDVQLARIEEAALRLLEKLEATVHHGPSDLEVLGTRGGTKGSASVVGPQASRLEKEVGS